MNRRTRKALTGAAGLAALALGITACSDASGDANGNAGADASEVTLTVGTLSTDFRQQFEASGLLEDAPYQVEWQDLSGDTYISQVASGAVDLGLWGFDVNQPTAVINSNSALSIVGVGVPGQEPADGELDTSGLIAIFAAPESGIESIEDLRGKTLVSSHFEGSTPDAVISSALADAGIDRSEVEVQYVDDPATAYTLFLNRQVDAISGLWNGSLAEDVRDNGSHVIYSENSPESPITRNLIASTQSLDDDQQREAIADFIPRLNTLLTDWQVNSRDEYAAVTSESNNVDLETAELVIEPQINALKFESPVARLADIQRLLDSYRSWGFYDQGYDAADIIDDRLDSAF